MVGRILAIALVASIGLSVVVLAVAILWSGGRIADGPSGSSAALSEPLTTSTGKWVVKTVARADASRTVAAELQITDWQGAPAPDHFRFQAMLVMVGHPMPPTTTRIEQAGPGSYRILGSAPMAGTWNLRLELPDGIIEVPINVMASR